MLKIEKLVSVRNERSPAVERGFLLLVTHAVTFTTLSTVTAGFEPTIVTVVAFNDLFAALFNFAFDTMIAEAALFTLTHLLISF